MTFVIFLLDVAATWVLLLSAVFVAARVLNGVGFVAALAGIGWANMHIHHLIGTSINSPFWAAALFGGALYQNSWLIENYGQKVVKYAFWTYILGGLIGWLSFAQIVSVR